LRYNAFVKAKTKQHLQQVAEFFTAVYEKEGKDAIDPSLVLMLSFSMAQRTRKGIKCI
jgi:hypothetical protein